MGVPRLYSLRPPGNQAKPTDPGLERMFRIEMKRDDMAAENIAAGDPVLLVCPETTAGGVGIAFLSSDVSKAQGPRPIAKIYDPLKKIFGLTMEDKCAISKYEGHFKIATKVIVSDVTPAVNQLHMEVSDALECWVRHSLARLPLITPGHTFDVTPQRGPTTFRKRSFKIEQVETEDQVGAIEPKGTKSAFLPYQFDIMGSKIEISNIPIRKQVEAPVNSRVVLEFPNLKGLDRQLEQLREHVDSINHVLDDHYKLESLMQPSPILLHGSAGVGKTAVLKSLEKANWAKVISIESSKTGVALAKIFAEAISSQPSLIVLDDLESLAGRESDTNLFAKEMTKQMEKLSGTRVQVVAATKRKFDIDQNLLLVFDECTIELPIPVKLSRAEILNDLVTSRASKDVLDHVASQTHAFTARDLRTLCNKACRIAFKKSGGLSNWMSSGVATREDFEEAMRVVHPSTMAEAYIEVPEVHWSDIAGSAEVKRKLQDAVDLPLKRPDLVKCLNLPTNSGILMYGPPGCSKTLTAKALATESGLNFIAVQGPSLISKYVGESEQKIRDVFRKAREAAPSVIFFDEIDSIAPNRGSGHEGLNTVATLLNEMDGVEAVTKVLVLAATNRPDAIDSALLRPGRLGATIFIGPPDKAAIESILKMCTDKMAKDEDLGLSEIAEKMVGDTEKCYSGADVAELCHNAGMIRAREALKNEEYNIALRKSDMESALAQAKPSLSIEAVEALRNWSIAALKYVN